MRKKSNPQAEVDAWNHDYGVGQQVRVTRDDGSIQEAVTTHEAFVLGGHTAVVMLDTISGCCKLDRVKAY